MKTERHVSTEMGSVLAHNLIRVRSPSVDPDIRRYAEMASGGTIA
jgi:hypothetical protein